MKRFNFALLILILCSGCNRGPEKYEEIGYWKKEKSRVYSVYASDRSWDDMHSYAKRKFWSERGLTMVYFFDDRQKTPNVATMKDPSAWGEPFESHWIASYWHWPNGEEKFEKHQKDGTA